MEIWMLSILLYDDDYNVETETVRPFSSLNLAKDYAEKWLALFAGFSPDKNLEWDSGRMTEIRDAHYCHFKDYQCEVTNRVIDNPIEDDYPHKFRVTVTT